MVEEQIQQFIAMMDETTAPAEMSLEQAMEFYRGIEQHVGVCIDGLKDDMVMRRPS